MKIVRDERADLITEARLISVALPVLEPMLERRHRAALQRLIAAHRDGRTDNAAISELSVIEGILGELRSKLSNLTLKEK